MSAGPHWPPCSRAGSPPSLLIVRIWAGRSKCVYSKPVSMSLKGDRPYGMQWCSWLAARQAAGVRSWTRKRIHPSPQAHPAMLTLSHVESTYPSHVMMPSGDCVRPFSHVAIR